MSPPANGTGISLDNTSYAISGGPAGTGIYRTLSNIVIREPALPTDFAVGGGTLILSAPVGFEFDPFAATAFVSLGLDVVPDPIIPIALTSGTVTLTFAVIGTDEFDILIVSGLRVRPSNFSPTSGQIYRAAGSAGGTALIAGLEGSARGPSGKNFGALSSVAGAPSQLKVEPLASGSPATTVPTGALSVRVTSEDKWGNPTLTVTGGGTVDLAFEANPAAGTSPNGTAPTIPATQAVTFTSGVGTATGFTLTNAETGPKITATSLGTGTAAVIPANGVTGTSAELTVTAGAVASVTMTTPPSATAGAGVAFAQQPAVTAKDQFGNLASTAITGTSAVASVTGGGATLVGTTTQPFNASGVATFADLAVNTVGTHTLTFTGGVASVQSSSFTITAGPPQNLLVEPLAGGNPATTVAAGTLSVRITARDEFNNVATQVTDGTVNLAFAGDPAGGTAPNSTVPTIPATQAVTFSNGVGTATGFVLTKAETGPRIKATSQGTGTATTLPGTGVTGTSAVLTVTAGAVTSLTMTTQPVGAAAGSALGTQPAVTAKDTYGNLASTAVTGTSVTASLTASAVTLDGTKTQSFNASGVAAFTNLQVNLVGSYTLTFTAGAGGPSVVSGAFSITPGTPATLLVQPLDKNPPDLTRQPTTSLVAGGSFTVRVTAQDAYGNQATQVTGGTRRLTLATNAGLAPNGAGPTVPGSAFTPPTVEPTFSAGIAEVEGFIFRNAAPGQTITVTVQSGGTLSLPAAGVTGSNAATPATVQSGSLNNFLVEQPAGGAIGTQTAGSPFGVRVTARDASNNVLSSGVNTFTGTVVVSSNVAGSAGLTTTAAFTGGVLGSHAVTLTGVSNGAATITVTDSATGLIASGSALFTVQPGALDNLLVEKQAGGAIGTQPAGSPFNVAITARDAFSNTLSIGANAFAGTVVVSSNVAGSAGLTTTAAFTNGVLASHGVTLTGAGNGTVTLTATAGAVASSSAAFTVQPAALAGFLVEQQAGGAIGTQTAGTSFNARVAARDAFGNTLSFGPNTFAGTVVVSSNVPGSAGLGTSAVFAGGVLTGHAVTLTGVNNGAATITVADSATALISGVSAPFTVQPGALNNFLVENAGGGTIGTQTAGVPVSVRITARDAFNNVLSFGTNAFADTVVLSSNVAGTAGLTTTAAFTSGVLASHGVTLTGAGDGMVTLTAAAGAISTATAAFAVQPGALSSFLVEKAGGGAIGTRTAGVPFDIRVTARDPFNNVLSFGANAFTGTVVLSSNVAGATGLGTSAAFTGGVLNSHALTFTGVNNGGAKIAVADSATGLITAESALFTVQPGALSNFAVEAAGGGAIGTQTAGVPFNVGVTARDQFNNVLSFGANAFAGTVVVSSNVAGAAGLGTSAAFGNGVLTSHAVTATGASNAGATITVADSATGLRSGTSAAFTVQPGALNKVLVEQAGGGAIGTQTAGSPFNVAMTARDQFNNVLSFGVNTFAGSVALSSNVAGSAGLTTTAALTNGVLTSHGVTLTGAGNGTVTLTATAGAVVTSSAVFTVQGGALNNFFVETAGGGAIGTQTAGTPLSIRVTARDAFNNVLSFGTNAFANTVAVSSNVAGTSGLGTSASFTGGVLTGHAVTLTGVNNGAATITVADSATGLISDVSTPFTVQPAALNSFLVENPGGGAIGTQAAGTPFSVTITARDSFHNVLSFGANTFAGTAVVSSNVAGTAGLTTTAAFTSGVLTSHGVTLTGAGNGTVTLTATAGVVSTPTAAFTVQPGALSSFLVEKQAGGPLGTQTAGSPFNIQVTARDQFNNVLSFGANAFIGTVTVSSNVAGSGLGTSAPFAGGVLSNHAVTFTGTNNGGAQITVVDSATGLVTAETALFTVQPGPLNNFLVEKTGGGAVGTRQAGVPFSIRITARDASNNTLSFGANTFTGSVVVSSNVPGTAGLTTTAPFVSGVLTNQPVTLTGVNNSARISVVDAAGGTVSGESAPFVMGPGAPTTLLVVSLDTNVPNDEGSAKSAYTIDDVFALRITAYDAFGNVATQLSGLVDLAYTTNALESPDGSPTVAAVLSGPVMFVAGAVEVPGFRFTNVASGQTLTATVRNAGLGDNLATPVDGVTGTTDAATVTPGAAAKLSLQVLTTAGVPTLELLAGQNVSVRVSATDAYGNPATDVTGSVDIAFTTNAAALPSISAPTVTSRSGVVTFTNGVSSVVTGFVFRRAETVRTITATVQNAGVDGNLAIPAVGVTGSSAEFTVFPATLDHFLVERQDGGPIADQTQGQPFQIRISALDEFNNVLAAGPNNLNGPGNTVVLSSSVAGSVGLGVTPPFVNGVLASHTVVLTGFGTAVTLTATDSPGGLGNGTQTGTSAPFVVESTAPPVLITPTPITLIAEQIAGTPKPDQLQKLTAFLAGASATDAVTGSAIMVTNNAPAFFPVGTTLVTFSATDVRGNTATTDVSVTIITVEAAIDALDQKVVSFALDRKVEKVLRHRLTDAQRAFVRGKIKTSSRRITDFIRRVTTETNKKITPAQSVALIADAQAINDVLALRLGSAPVGLILISNNITALDAQVANAGLDASTTQKIRIYLSRALADVAPGRERQVRGHLRGFIDEVDDQRDKGKIGGSLATDLIVKADALIDDLLHLQGGVPSDLIDIRPQIRLLSESIEDLQLARGTEKALQKQLEDALRKIENGDPASKVRGDINEFSSKVNKDTPKRIEPDDAAVLIEEATLILDLLAPF